MWSYKFPCVANFQEHSFSFSECGFTSENGLPVRAWIYFNILRIVYIRVCSISLFKIAWMTAEKRSIPLSFLWYTQKINRETPENPLSERMPQKRYSNSSIWEYIFNNSWGIVVKTFLFIQSELNTMILKNDEFYWDFYIPCKLKSNPGLENSLYLEYFTPFEYFQMTLSHPPPLSHQYSDYLCYCSLFK